MSSSTPDPAEAPPAFSPRWPWLGGDLQTLRNAVMRPFVALPSARSETVRVDLADGTSDQLLMLVDHPRAPVADAAWVLLVHGLTGCCESTYMRASAAALLARGHVVARLNLRGAGPGRGLAHGHYNAGSSAEVAAAAAALRMIAGAAPLAAMGFSLGGNILLRLLGDRGAQAGLAAAASVSAPIDLAAASRRIGSRRNAVYEGYLLRRMRREFLASPGGMAAALRSAAATARGVREFDDRVVAPLAGFAGADDYYARCSATAVLEGLRTPTLIVHAGDDPWIPIEAYRAVPWARIPAAETALGPRGGHVGFHGRGAATAWHDRMFAWFLRRGGLAR